MHSNDPREEYVAREMLVTNVQHAIAKFFEFQSIINLIKGGSNELLR